MPEARDTETPVVVLGAGGFIGRVLVDHLRALGSDVRAYSRADCDMTDLQAVQACLAHNAGARYVFLSCISRNREDSFEAFELNVRMAHNFAQAAQDSPCGSLVYLSSTDIYGNRPELPVTEDSPVKPDGYYALSKLVNERILFHRLACPVTAIRLPGIYGPEDRGKSVLGMFTRRVLAGETVRVFGDGSTLRDFVHIDDLCRIIGQLLDAPQPGVLNIATGTSRRLLDILQTISDIAQRPLNLVMAPPEARSNDLVFDIRALRQAVGGFSPTGLEKGLELLVAHLKRNPQEGHR